MPIRHPIRFVLIAFAVVGGLASAGTAQQAAGQSTDRAAANRVVVTPRPGAVVRSHRVRLRVRARGLSGVLRVRLNGVQIGDHFALPRHGVRTLPASVSYGLRRGKNVLEVRVRRRGKPARRATVRFSVRSPGPLVGAGRDRRVVVGSDIGLHGQAKGVGASPSNLRWKLITAPAPLEPAQGSPPPAEITSPDGPTARLSPTALGTYVLKLTHGHGRSATSDRVELDAVPPNPLVPIETVRMDDPTFHGIKVGDQVYDDPHNNSTSAMALQVLVLDRKTLEPVSDSFYIDGNANRLRADIAKLDDTNLVIVSLGGFYDSAEGQSLPLDELLSRIGVPTRLCTAGCNPRPGTFSAIGVPGMKAGEADWNYRAA